MFYLDIDQHLQYLMSHIS
jgi:hypothetical protein